MTPRRRAKLRRRRWFIGLLTAFALLSLFGFFGLPPIIKSQAEKRLTELLHRPTTIGRVRVNPYQLALTIEDFNVQALDKKSSFMGWKRLYVNFEVASFFTGEWHFQNIEVESPTALVAVLPDGSLNFSDLLAGPPGAKPAPARVAPAKLRPIRIDHLSVGQARIDFRDHSRAQPFETILGPVSFQVTDFRTVSTEHAPYNFEAVTESGEKFAWQGWMYAAPFRSAGELSVTGLLLKKYAPYYAEKLGVDLVDGRLTVRGKYEVSFGEKVQVMKLLDGAISVRNLKLVERTTGEPLLELPAADLKGATADGLTFKSSVAEITLTGGRARLRREADGTLNLSKLLPPPAAPATPAPAAAVAPSAMPPIKLTVGAVEVRDFAVEVQDLAAPRPVQFGISGLAVSLKNFTLDDGALMPVEVAMGWQPSGTMRVLGQVSLKPVSADLQVKVEGLGVLPFSPYLEQFMNARITQGAVSVDGHATLALAEGRPPAATFDGNVWVEKFGLVDGVRNEELAGFGDFVCNGIKAVTSPMLTVSVKEVNVSGPYARVVVDEDKAKKGTKTVNLFTVFGTREEFIAKKVAQAEKPVENPPDIRVDRLVIDGGDYSFTDRSIKPQVHMAITQFNGTLTDLSSLTPTKGEADIKAMVDGVGPVAIAGTINPLGQNLYLDAKIDFKGIDLQPVSPYLGRYAGYDLARGKLSVAVQARVADRKVDATNVITLHQFTFGRATNSREATKLPVRLGLALLKDVDGNVVIDVPVQGDLNDPEFRVGKVVLRVIVNMLTKAAVSPFSMLGAMFGGGAEELGYQEFTPGGTLLAEGSQAKLETVAKALAARPALNLDIEGGYDAAADGYVLKIKRIAETAKREIWEEKHAQDPNILPPDQLEIPPEEYATKVKQMFDKKFPPGTQFGTPLPPPPMIMPPPEHKSDNIFRRMYDTITLKSARERRAMEKAQREAHVKYVAVARAAVDAGLPFEEMIGRLAETVELTPDDFLALADARAKFVRDYLIGEGKISPDRLFLTRAVVAAPVPVTETTATNADQAAPDTRKENAAQPGPRVWLHLQ